MTMTTPPLTVATTNPADRRAVIRPARKARTRSGSAPPRATVGSHSFSVTIGVGHAKAKKTADADGNPLEAHIASGIKGLAITSVT